MERRMGYCCCYPRHRHVEFITFLQSLARRHSNPELYAICDNYGTNKHPAVKQWLAAHPCFHLNLTPTSASWLNLVECWFVLITDRPERPRPTLALNLTCPPNQTPHPECRTYLRE